MARTQLRGGDQLLNFTVLREDLVLDFLGASNWDITNGAANATITGVSDGINATDVATKGQLDVAVAAINATLNGFITFKGAVDAGPGQAAFEALAHSAGDFYKVSVSGTIATVAVTAGDNLYFKNDVLAGAIVAADFDVIDNTEAVDILRTGDIVDSLLSSSSTAPLAANQGLVLKGLIDALDALVNLRTYGEFLTITDNSANLPALANTPIAGTERVHLNGLLVERGAGNDYTIVGGVITMEYLLKTNDKVLVHYER